MVLGPGFEAVLLLQGLELLQRLAGPRVVFLPDELLGLAQVLVGQDVGGKLDPLPGGGPGGSSFDCGGAEACWAWAPCRATVKWTFQSSKTGLSL